MKLHFFANLSISIQIDRSIRSKRLKIGTNLPFFFPLVFQRFNLESCRLANILVRKRAVKKKKNKHPLVFALPKERKRVSLLISCSSTSSRFEFSAVSPPPLCLFITTVSEAINLFHSVSSSSSRAASRLSRPPLLQPSSSRLGFVTLFPSLRSRDRYYGAYLAFLPSCISRFLACRRGYLVAWLLGYSVTKVAKEKGPRSPLCADFCETKRLTSPFRPPPFPLPPPPLFFPLLSALLFTPLCFDQPPSNENARSLILRGLELVFSCLEMPPL